MPSTVIRRGVHCIIRISRNSNARIYQKVYDMLKSDGFRYYSSEHEWVGSATKADKYEIILRHVDRIQPVIRKKILPPTLCWGCIHAGDGRASECSWVAEFKPVEGWKAVATQIGVSYSTCGRTVPKTEQSFCVLECPLFFPG